MSKGLRREAESQKMEPKKPDGLHTNRSTEVVVRVEWSQLEGRWRICVSTNEAALSPHLMLGRYPAEVKHTKRGEQEMEEEECWNKLEVF